MRDAAWMADLLRRTPVHAIDVQAAGKAGDVAALSYRRAMDEWLAEAALALAEADLPVAMAVEGRVGPNSSLKGSGPVGKPPSELVSTHDFQGSRFG